MSSISSAATNAKIHVTSLTCTMHDLPTHPARSATAFQSPDWEGVQALREAGTKNKLTAAMRAIT